MKEVCFLPDFFPLIARYLRNGGVAVLPTDTIPGFAADASNRDALLKIARLKNRHLEKPFLLLLPDFYTAEKLCEFSPLARQLVKRFWPGKLTLLLPRKKGVLPNFFPQETELAIRVPADPLIQKFLNTFGRPLVSTSVNLAGAPPLCDFTQIIQLLKNDPVLVAAGNAAQDKVPSTLVGIRDEQVCIYRLGSILEHEILMKQ